MNKKKIDICGLGSSIVDQQFKITPSILKKLNCRANEMTLASPKEHQEILTILQKNNCEYITSCGGSVTNSIVAASSLGSKCHQFTCVSNDEEGRVFLESLKEKNVSYTESNQSQEDIPTAKCIVMITPNGERTMSTCLGISSHFNSTNLDLDAIENCNYFYLEGYMVTDNFETTNVLLEKAQKSTCKIALSLSDPWVASTFQSKLEKWCQYGIDIIFCNEAEAISFTKATTLNEAKESLKTYCRRYAITCGANGAILFDGTKETNIKGKNVPVIDTNGAGDIFSGTFLHYINKDHSFEIAGEHANYAASKLVQHFGSRLPNNMYHELIKDIISSAT